MLPPAVPAAGELFGSYRLREKLGEGGMAVVFRAERVGAERFERAVALKLIHATMALDPAFAGSFADEARLGGRLAHDNIVATVDFGIHEGQYFLAMEYVEGFTLHDAIVTLAQRGETFPPEIALQILAEVCAGLEYAHDARGPDGRPLNIVHRDLKPSNVLLGTHGAVKIADFGIARADSNSLKTQHTGMIKGTVQYMSPEQAWGKRDLDRRSDLFSAVVVLYEMLTCQHLYTGQSVEQNLRFAQDAQHSLDPRHLPKGRLGDQLRAFFAKGLAADREKRFQDAVEMLDAIEEMLAQFPKRTRLASWLRDVFRTGGAGASGAVSSPSLAETERRRSKDSASRTPRPVAAPERRWVLAVSGAVILVGVLALLRPCASGTGGSHGGGTTAVGDAVDSTRQPPGPTRTPKPPDTVPPPPATPTPTPVRPPTPTKKRVVRPPTQVALGTVTLRTSPVLKEVRHRGKAIYQAQSGDTKATLQLPEGAQSVELIAQDGSKATVALDVVASATRAYTYRFSSGKLSEGSP